MIIRVTYRCEVYIEGDNVEECKSKFDRMPLFNSAAEIYNPSFVEISSAVFTTYCVPMYFDENGRKVMTCILKKPKKGENLTFLTFLSHNKWLASVQ